MIKTYTFDYDGEAEVVFKVDTEKFDTEMAKATLDFFSWDRDYDRNADPIEEVMKKYAIRVLHLATSLPFCNVVNIITAFYEVEGFANIDGSQGIELVRIQEIEIDEDKLQMKVS